MTANKCLLYVPTLTVRVSAEQRRLAESISGLVESSREPATKSAINLGESRLQLAESPLKTPQKHNYYNTWNSGLLQLSPTRTRLRPRSLTLKIAPDAAPTSHALVPKSSRTPSDAATEPKPGVPPCSSEP